MKIKTFQLLIVVVFLNISAQAQLKKLHKKNHIVNKTLKEIVDYKPFNAAFFAFYAVDLNSGEEVSFNNAHKVLKPGSTQKLISTAAALELLGADYTLKTRLMYSGSIDTVSKTLNGNLYIVGGGDPTLGSKYFDTTSDKQFLAQMDSAVENLGIDTIRGRVIANAQCYSLDIVPPSWSWQNMGNYFGAGPSGLVIYDNYYTVHFKTGDYQTPVTIKNVDPEIEGLSFDNGVISDSISWDNTNIFGAPYSNLRYLRGTLPINRDDFGVKGSTPDPALLASVELQKTLIASDVVFENSATTSRLLGNYSKINADSLTEIITIESPTLSDIITETNVHSINLFAEHCLIEAGMALNSHPITKEAADSVKQYWSNLGMDTEGMLVYDGSGLSHYDAFSPYQMVFLLKHMKNSNNFNIFYSSLAIGGKTGTIKKMFKGTAAEGNIHAKSGTVNKAKAYSGYVTSASGREIAFSMMVNNFSCSSREARAQLEKLMISLAELKK